MVFFRLMFLLPVIHVVAESFYAWGKDSPYFYLTGFANGAFIFLGCLIYFNLIESKCEEVDKLKIELASLKKEVEKLNGLSSKG